VHAQENEWKLRVHVYMCLKKIEEKNTFVERILIYIYTLYVYAHTPTRQMGKETCAGFFAISISPFFFSLSTLWAQPFTPVGVFSSNQGTFLDFLLNTHTHIHTPAMPPARRLSFGPENCGKLYHFGVFRLRQNLCAYYQSLRYPMRTPFVRYALFPSTAGFYYSII